MLIIQVALGVVLGLLIWEHRETIGAEMLVVVAVAVGIWIAVVLVRLAIAIGRRLKDVPWVRAKPERPSALLTDQDRETIRRVLAGEDVPAPPGKSK